MRSRLRPPQAAPGASSTPHDRKRSCSAHRLDYGSDAMLKVVAGHEKTAAKAVSRGRAGSRRPLSPAVKKQLSICRRGQPVTGRERAHCPVSAFDRVTSTRPALLRPNCQTAITFGIPSALALYWPGAPTFAILTALRATLSRSPCRWLGTPLAPKHLDSKASGGSGWDRRFSEGLFT